MKRLCIPIVLLVALFFHSNSMAQPFSIGETNLTFTDPARGGRSVPTQIYYPASTAGTNTSPAAGMHCLVVFGHGFLIGYSQYQWLANALVPNGYIVAFPDTETGFPSHGDFGDDIAFLVGAIQAEASVSGSVLFGAVSPNSAVGGHSMGGGASFLAAGGNTGINALFNFAAAETNPSAIAAAASVSVPTLVIEGTDDCVTPSAGNTGDMYAALGVACKSLISITGASHCQFANSDFVCGLGQIGCGGMIAQGDQENIVITYLLPFLNYHLKSDCDEGTVFDNLLTTPVGSTTQSNCVVPDPSVCATTCANVDLNIQFDGFPAQTSWEIVDANNVIVASSNGTYTGVAANSTTTESPCLADGCYTLTFFDAVSNGMCPFQSSAVGVSTFITPGTLIAPGSIVGTLSLVVSPGLCGNYTLSNSAGTTLVSGGGGFGVQESQTFCLNGGTKNAISTEEKIKLYPTKVNDLVWIESTVSLDKILIYDAQGKIQVELIPNELNRYNVSKLPAGMYWVELLHEEGKEVKKMIK